MSGSAGLWPIGPTAKPAKPAPPTTTSIAEDGTSLAQGRPCMSTNIVRKNSMLVLSGSSLEHLAGVGHR